MKLSTNVMRRRILMALAIMTFCASACTPESSIQANNATNNVEQNNDNNSNNDNNLFNNEENNDNNLFNNEENNDYPEWLAVFCVYVDCLDPCLDSACDAECATEAGPSAAEQGDALLQCWSDCELVHDFEGCVESECAQLDDLWLDACADDDVELTLSCRGFAGCYSDCLDEQALCLIDCEADDVECVDDCAGEFEGCHVDCEYLAEDLELWDPVVDCRIEHCIEEGPDTQYQCLETQCAPALNACLADD
ncbi:MAG: hypothetical protein H0U74_08675 [Bradymonadaceae bacterium]|nr:hypothetical protein [Lujinxingiaceae bacterium]